MGSFFQNGAFIPSTGSHLQFTWVDRECHNFLPRGRRRIALVIPVVGPYPFNPFHTRSIELMVFLNWFILTLVIFTATGLLFNRDWRWSLGLLAIQYLLVFWMVQTHWPVSMAAAKIVTGWMACAVLGIAQLNSRKDEESEDPWLKGRLFQIFAAGMVLIVTYSLSPLIVSWMGVGLPVAWGAMLLIGLGLLHLGITSDSFQVIIGLLTVLAGFEVLYAAVESSVLVAALLAVVNLGLALTGAYFLTGIQEDAS
jgi:hypothetical protein